MHVAVEVDDRGVHIEIDGTPLSIGYPEAIWRPFAAKRELAAELAVLATYGLPVMRSDDDVVIYDCTRPRFLDRYERWFRAGLPHLAETSGTSLDALTARVERTERRFAGPSLAWPQLHETAQDRAVLALTMGKDSLASIAVASALGLSLTAVHVAAAAATVTARALRIDHMTALGAERGLDVHVVDDGLASSIGQLAKVSDNGLHWSPGIATFCAMLVPFTAHARARYMLIGNERDLDYAMRSPTGALVATSPLQSAAGMAELGQWLAELTGGTTELTSVVASLHRLAGHKLVHAVAPEIGRHQISCRRATSEQRWCCACRTCAENELFITAMGQNAEDLGFSRSMLGPGDRERFYLFSRALDAADPYHFHLARQELLAFELIARRTGVRAAELAFDGIDFAELARMYLVPASPPPLPLAERAAVAAARLLSGPF